jgi:hypothetical protein
MAPNRNNASSPWRSSLCKRVRSNLPIPVYKEIVLWYRQRDTCTFFQIVDQEQRMLNRYQPPKRDIPTPHQQQQQQQQPSRRGQYRKPSTAIYFRTCNSRGHLLSACPCNQIKLIAGAVVPIQQRVALIKIFTETPKLNLSQRRKRNREEHMLRSNLQEHGNSSQSSQSLHSFNTTLRDRLPTSGASVNAPEAYVDYMALGSP